MGNRGRSNYSISEGKKVKIQAQYIYKFKGQEISDANILFLFPTRNEKQVLIPKMGQAEIREKNVGFLEKMRRRKFAYEIS